MLESDVFRKIIAKLDSLNVNDDFRYETCWKEETELLSKDISATIDFIKNDCTASEFSWMSEVFEDIVEKTKSREFLQCIEETSKKFPEDCNKYNIAGAIEAAKSKLAFAAPVPSGQEKEKDHISLSFYVMLWASSLSCGPCFS